MTDEDLTVLVRFLADYDDKHPDFIVAYLSGMEIEVDEQLARRALNAGAAELLDEDGQPIDLDAVDAEDA